MPEYDNNNSGVLFKNDKKETEKHPDYKGSCEVNGVEYWLASWLKTSSKTGEKFMSLSFTPKEDQAQQTFEQDNNTAVRQGQPAPPAPVAEPEDDIPF